MYKLYFQLSIKILLRKIKAAGLPPAVGIFLIAGLFVAGSLYFWQKFENAEIYYIGIALAFCATLHSGEKKEFLLQVVGKSCRLKIQYLESLICAVPFLAFLLFKQEWSAALLGLVIVPLASLSTLPNGARTVPTPFSRFPFEFPAGFRRSWWMFLGCYALLAIGIKVGNPNLGIGGLVGCYAICLSYYIQPEPIYFVAMYNCTPKQFLLRKIRVAVGLSLLTALPMAISLLLLHPDLYLTVLTFLLLGPIYVSIVLLGKYTAYPAEINLWQGVALALSLSFPPAALLILPYYFIQSCKRISTYLP